MFHINSLWKTSCPSLTGCGKTLFLQIAQKGPVGLLGGLYMGRHTASEWMPFFNSTKSNDRPATRRPKPGTRPEGVGLSVAIYAKKSRGMRHT